MVIAIMDVKGVQKFIKISEFGSIRATKADEILLK